MVDDSSMIHPTAFSSHPARCPASKEPIEKDVWEAWGDRPVWARGAAAPGARLLTGTAARFRAQRPRTMHRHTPLICGECADTLFAGWPGVPSEQ